MKQNEELDCSDFTGDERGLSVMRRREIQNVRKEMSFLQKITTDAFIELTNLIADVEESFMER